MELAAPVYGLNAAPALWHETLTSWLKEQGFRMSLLEPCLYVRTDRAACITGLVLIEVDGLAMGVPPGEEEKFKSEAMKRFKFGKWKTG